MQAKVLELLESILPKETKIIVSEYKPFYGDTALKIAFAVSDHQINNVRNQFVQAVSLSLDITNMELEVQIFGGMGGNRIYCKPNLELRAEKYLAMAGRKVSFRKPKKEEKFVLRAIKKFAENWLKTLKENENSLMYKDLVDYTPFVK